MKRLLLCCMIFCIALAAQAKPNINNSLPFYLNKQAQDNRPLASIAIPEEKDALYFTQMLTVVDQFPPEGKEPLSSFIRKDFKTIKEIHMAFLPAKSIKEIISAHNQKADLFGDDLYSISFITNNDNFTRSMFIFFATDRLKPLSEAQVAARLAYEIYGHVYPFLFQPGYTSQKTIQREKTAYRASIDFLNRVLAYLQKNEKHAALKEFFLQALQEEQARLDGITK